MPGALAETPDTTFDILMTPAAASGKRPDESATDEVRGGPRNAAPEPAGPEAIVTPTPQADGARRNPLLSADALRDKAVAAGLVAARETTAIPGYNKWAEGALMSSPGLRFGAGTAAAVAVHSRCLGAAAGAGGPDGAFLPRRTGGCRARPAPAAGVGLRGTGLRHPATAPCRPGQHRSLRSAGRPGAGRCPHPVGNVEEPGGLRPGLALAGDHADRCADNAVLRRVLRPADYLPQKADPTLFPPNGEIGIRLWLEAKDVTAAGYRLYVFYP